MAVNKNFVVKNGLEVNTRLILADANTNKVGIGSTAPKFELEVAGGIGATDVYVSGITTALEYLNVGAEGNVLSVIAGAGGISTSKVGIGTSNPEYLLEVRSPVSTGHTAVYIHGDVQITGDLNVDDITLDDATLSNLTVTEAFNVTSPGISTFGGLVNITDTTDSTTYNNGALVIDGGLGVEKSVNIGGDLDVTGNVYIGGTTVSLRGTDVFIENKDIVLGYTTAITPNDDTANHAGIAIASTEGSPLVSFEVSGINTLPDTYKQMMWFRSGTLGFSTDMFGFNYGVAVGTTTVADGIRLAVGSDVRITDDTINTTNLNVNGIVTSTSGVTTYYGDGSQLSGVIGGIGINTSGGLVGFGVTYLHFYGAGVSTTQYDSSVGIATIFFEGGSGSASIGIGTTPGEAFTTGIITAGNLWYNSSIGRLFIYYEDDDSSQWVDTSPFNVGVITSLTNVSLAQGSASNPSLYFLDDSSTGFFSPADGELTVVSAGSSILNVNSSGIDVTGIGTIQTLDVNGAADLTQLSVSGVSTFLDNVRIADDNIKLQIGGGNDIEIYHSSGVNFIEIDSGSALSIKDATNTRAVFQGTGAVDLYYGANKKFETIGAGVTVTGTTFTDQLSVSGVSTFSTLDVNGAADLTQLNVSGVSTFSTLKVGTGVTISGGIVTATSFYGDGSNLENTGSTLSPASGTQRVVVTSQTSGTMTASATDADLTFDATTNTLSVSDIQISSGIITTTAGSFELYKPVLHNYSEKVNTIGNTGASCNIDLADGAYVIATLDQTTSFTFTTGITTGSIGFALQLTNGSGGPYSITWPVSVKWPNNVVPTRTTTDGKTDIWVFNTSDNGTTWYGNLALYNFS